MDNNQICFFTEEVTKEEHTALRMLYAGEASAYQQRLALQVIVNKFSRSHDLLFVPGHPDQTAFLQGRGYVGQRILKYLNLPVGRLKNEVDHVQE